MYEERVDDLLVEWEMARQLGSEIAAEELCKDCPHLLELVSQGIDILRRTTWMLEDPAPVPFAPDVLESVSQITRVATDRPDSQGSAPHETSASNRNSVDTNRSDLDDGRDHAVVPMALPRIDGFQLEGELGRGGFGVVYRALDEKLDRHVAIKIPLLDNPAQREKYMREARHAARVETVGIVPVLQVGTTETGLPFVVQKLIEGKSLAEILYLGGKLSPMQTAILLVEVCKAVGTAHTHSLVHRDLKPANILIDETGKPWVTDFGLAVTEDDQAERKGEIAGTPSYMAPEQLQGKVDWFDGRTDIWALGIIMYEALTGKLPFKAPTRGELREQILKREPRPICQRLPALPKNWDAILQRCCAKSIQDRYDSAFDLAKDLDDLRDGLDPASQASFNPVLEDLQRSRNPLSGADSSRPRVPLRSELRQERSLAPETLKTIKSWAWPGIAVLVFVGLLVAASTVWFRLGGEGESYHAAPEGNLPTNQLSTNQLSTPIPSARNPGDGGNQDTLSASRARRQFVVSLDEPTRMDDERERWFSSIQSAIDLAEDNQEILIRPGEYRESLRISRSVALRGERMTSGQLAADEMQVRIMYSRRPAMMIERGASLSLVGIDVLPENVETRINAIQVDGGSLQLEKCSVVAAHLSCVKLEWASRFEADDCTFTARHEPAITAKRAEVCNLRKCSFQLLAADLGDATGVESTQADISLPSESVDDQSERREPSQFSSSRDPVTDDRSTEMNLVGIQAIQMPGTLTDCTFQGPTATAVQWTESDDMVSFDNCQFRNLLAGIVAYKCSQLSIQGTLGKAQFWGCRKSVELNACNGRISGCQLDFEGALSERTGTIGIQIHETADKTKSPAIQIDACQLNGFDSAMIVSLTSVAASDLSILNSQSFGIRLIGKADFQLEGPSSVIRNSLGIGILVEGSAATLRRCRIEECSTAGIVADGLEHALVAEGCSLNLNGVGLILLSGAANLTAPEISGSKTGILVAYKSSFYPAPKNDAPLSLTITNGGRIAASSHAIHFLSPGTYQLGDCLLDDGQGVPFLDAGLTEVALDEVVEVKQIR